MLGAERFAFPGLLICSTLFISVDGVKSVPSCFKILIGVFFIVEIGVGLYNAGDILIIARSIEQPARRTCSYYDKGRRLKMSLENSWNFLLNLSVRD